MNKSIITNFIALVCTLAGFYLGNHILYTVGLFALSGAITNWLAVHMLFEKVPLLYGSGVIPARFEDFKLAIRQLMMEQFFTKENIDRFLSTGSGAASSIDLTPVIEKVDLTPAFNNFVIVIENSSFASMLAMVGGSEALQPMKEPFIEKMKEAGVISLKIEGRGRDSRYVDVVTTIYRKALDGALSTDEIQNGIKELEKVFHRQEIGSAECLSE